MRSGFSNVPKVNELPIANANITMNFRQCFFMFFFHSLAQSPPLRFNTYISASHRSTPESSRCFEYTNIYFSGKRLPAFPSFCERVGEKPKQTLCEGLKKEVSTPSGKEGRSRRRTKPLRIALDCRF